MIKLVFPLHRLPELSREQFQTYWFENHAPLVSQHAETLGIKRYVQTHTRNTPLNDALRASREGPESYDGIAELWFESEEALTAAMQTPDGSADSGVLHRRRACSNSPGQPKDGSPDGTPRGARVSSVWAHQKV
jgi:uncharacterized protein (TIGR02118 family)